MAIFLSAGHYNADPGATGIGGIKEADETKKLRDAVLNFIQPQYKVITDNDNESLSQYLNRIKPGSGSVCLEIHFDAANGKASGTTGLFKKGANINSVNMSWELTKFISKTIGIPVRGNIDETKSHRGRLGFTRKDGATVLLEICFIDNASDMKKYDAGFLDVAEGIAKILMKYDDLIN